MDFYELYFRDSQLTSLSFRPYMVNTSKAIFSHNSITEVPLETLKAFGARTKVLHINNNKLKWLPEKMSTIEFKYLGFGNKSPGLERRLYFTPPVK